MPRHFNGKPLTDAERAARRQAARDRLEHAARALLTSDGWRRWIKVRATNGLSRYSLHISGRPVANVDTYGLLALATCPRRVEGSARGV